MLSCSTSSRLASLLIAAAVIAACAGVSLVSADEPPENTIQAVDWSKFQRAHTGRDMERLKEAGVELVILGSWHGRAIGTNPYCSGDLARARAVGLKTAIYVVVDGPEGPDPDEAVLRAVDACGRETEHVLFFAIDAEVESITEDRIHEAAEKIRELSKTPILYTAHWFWHGKLGNPQMACDLPLWNANYDHEPDFDFDRNPYGCWSAKQVVGEQYSNKSTIAGLELDHNTFLLDFLVSLEPTATLTPTTPTPTQTPTATAVPSLTPYKSPTWFPVKYPGTGHPW